MPTITNTSILNQAKPICKVLKARGENLSAEHTATILVRAILEELGDVETLKSTDPDDIALRKTLLTLAKPFMTASKNFQSTYLACTNGDDGQPLMPKATASEKGIDGEFV